MKNADTFWVVDAENVSAFFIEINRIYHAYYQKCGNTGKNVDKACKITYDVATGREAERKEQEGSGCMEQVLAILDGEEMYARRLLQFFSSQKELNFSVAAFTSEEKLAVYMERHKIALLLCEAEMYAQLMCVPDCPVMLLSDRSCVREPGGPRMVFKFQSAADILKEILLYYEEVCPGGAVVAHVGAAKICTVLSPAGGCGVTAMAELLAQELSRQSKVLFISFDPFYFLELSGDARKDALSEAIYYAKQNSEAGKKKQNEWLQKKGNLSCLCGVAQWADISECSSKEVAALLQELSGESYDFVVIDGGGFTDVLVGCMALSHVLFELVKESEEFRKKERYFREQVTFRIPEVTQKLVQLESGRQEECLQKMLEHLGKK